MGQKPAADANLEFADITCQTLHQMCMAGDETAWRYLYNYILVIIRAQGTIAPDTPEDVAQEICLRLTARGLDAIKNPNAFRGYVKTMIRNHFIDRLRQHTPAAVPLHGNDDEQGAVDPPSNAPGPDDMTQGKHLLKMLKARMKKLNRSCRDILEVYLNYKICGRPKSYKEMAAQFGLTVGGTGARVKRCLEQLCAFSDIRTWIDDVLQVRH